MGIIRFVFIACVIWIVVITIKKLRQVGQDRQQHDVGHKQMVQCVTCSVYVPEDDALCKSYQYFCCNNHMETDLKKN
jgi:ribosomal protein S26